MILISDFLLLYLQAVSCLIVINGLRVMLIDASLTFHSQAVSDLTIIKEFRMRIIYLFALLFIGSKWVNC